MVEIASNAYPYTVGLTGGIGSGKSMVAQGFAELGAAIVDTDLIAHALTAANGVAMPAIQTEFGPQYLAADGSLARASMRERIFHDPLARTRLEQILHPLIRLEALAQVKAAHQSPYVILVVPLLLESGQYKNVCARVLVVDCPPEIQIQRVMARSKLERAQIEAIMAAQIDRTLRLQGADDVIDNSGSFALLQEQIMQLHNKYSQAAASARSMKDGNCN